MLPLLKEEVNCSKTNSFHESILKKYVAHPVPVQFQLILYLGIHSAVKLEKWALSGKVYT